jgi:predicted amidophosphoribosyltransferase
MTDDEPARSKAKRREDGSTSWFASKKEEAPEKKVMIRVERSVKRKVLKLGKKGRRHASEAYESAQVTSKDMEITREVLESVGGSPVAPAPAPSSRSDQSHEPKTFTCGQCGARVPIGASLCPKCDCHYLNDISDEQLRDLESAEREVHEGTLPETGRMIERTDAPCIHFDAVDGTVSYLQHDYEQPNVSVVCSNCDTEIEFEADRCPICGTKLDKAESGLVGLFTGMEFDSDESAEMDCPFCGEHVVLVNGTCPACNEAVRPAAEGDPAETIDPIIHMENVVFLHLDVPTGQVNFMQKLARNQGFEQITVQLEGIGHSGFDKDWKSLSRV